MIFSALVAHAHRTGLAVEPGFRSKRVKWLVDLDNDGNVQDVRFASSSSRPLQLDRCPDLQQPEMLALSSYLRRARGIDARQAAHFLVDVCGTVTNWPGSVDDQEKTSDRHQTFMTLITLASLEVDALKPIVACCTSALELQRIRTSLQKLQAHPNEKITFVINGNLLANNECWHAWWRGFRLALLPQKQSELALSIISGKPVVPARTHPKIMVKGIGVLAAGASLISIFEDAFRSYGFVQAEHSPFHPNEAAAYQVALQALLEDAPVFGHLKIVHWYEHEVPLCRNPFSALFDHRNELDFEMVSTRKRIEGLHDEMVRSETQGRQEVAARFFAIAVTGADGRIRIKDWHANDLSQFTIAVNAWLNDLEVVDVTGMQCSPSPSLESLLRSLKSRQKEPKEASANYIKSLRNLVVPLWRAALNPKIPIPNLAINHAIIALRCDAANGALTRAWNSTTGRMLPERERLIRKVAILKASLRRNGDTEIFVCLNPQHSSKAYQCGRLTAQLIRFQQWVDKTKAPNQHRLFGLALAAPKTILEPSIWTSLQGLDRLTMKRSGLKPRVLTRFLKTWEGVGADLPQHFSLQDQAYFALGYYQQFAFDSIQNLEEDADEEITTTEATRH